MPQNRILYLFATTFLVAGFATGLNDLLVPHFKSIFSLDHSRAALVPACFFAAYLVISPLAGKWLGHLAAPQGVRLSMVTMIFGGLVFLGAVALTSFPLFLLGLLILASGGVLLQLFGNPYLTALSPAGEASRQLTFLIAFTPLGTALAGPVAGPWLFREELRVTDLFLPYGCLVLVLVGALICAGLLRWPSVAAEAGTQDQARWWKIPAFRWGALGIFGYVGSEVGVGSYLIAVATLPRYGSMSAVAAARLVGIYWGGAMLGRFVGPLYMSRIGTLPTLALHLLLAALGVVGFLSFEGVGAIYCLVAIGFAHSIMYPTITAQTLEGQGPMARTGSAVLCTAVGGGALLPYLQGQLADVAGPRISFAVPLLGYAMVAAFLIWNVRYRSSYPGQRS